MPDNGLTAWRRALVITGGLSVASLPLAGAMTRAVGLPLGSTGPYVVPEHAGLLYVLAPLAILSSFALVLAPGLMLAVVFRRASTFAGWIANAFLISLVVVSIWAGLATSVAGAPITGSAFAILVLVLAAACAIWTDRLVRTGQRPTPRFERGDGSTLLLMLGLIVLTWWLMSPKFLWEDLNGDGAHAFESSRLLVRQALPFWPRQAGPIANFPGLSSMIFAFPNAWFLRLFGELDVSVRIPFLLYLAVLFAMIVTMGGREVRKVPPLTQAAVAVSLLAYAYAMAYSATYNPYSADLALPATQDTLLVICFLALVDAYYRREWGWAALTAALTYTSLPNGLLLLGFLLVADALVTRPVAWRQLSRLAGIIVGCVVGASVVTRLLPLVGGYAPGGEYGLVATLRYFAFLQFTDWSRLILIVVPAGIVPFVICWRWSLLDRPARALTLVTAAYFLFVFVQARIALHHLVPAMLIPVLVAVRVIARNHRTTLRWSLTWVGAGAVAVVLSLPRQFTIHRAASDIGRSISIQTGSYLRSDPVVFSHVNLLNHLFPFDWDPRVPFEMYGGSPTSWNRYSRHGAVTEATNYAVLLAGASPPPGMHAVASDSGATLYVRDDQQWEADQHRHPPSPAGSRTYYLPRCVLFRGLAADEGQHFISVVDVLEGMGFDMSGLLTRLGVTR